MLVLAANFIQSSIALLIALSLGITPPLGVRISICSGISRLRGAFKSVIYD